MSEAVYAKVGEAIRAKRGETGMTQALLAGKTGLGRTSITNIENGTQAILLHQFIDIARALQLDILELLASVDASREKPRTAAVGGALADLLVRLDRPVQPRRR